jgi:hypothetical protein
MTRQRGNPNWGRPMLPASILCTEFELQVRQLQLAPEAYVFSDQLRGWCERNRNRFYIPEWLLNEWDIRVDPHFSDAIRTSFQRGSLLRDFDSILADTFWPFNELTTHRVVCDRDRGWPRV